jgi:hypothetical protein
VLSTFIRLAVRPSVVKAPQSKKDKGVRELRNTL